MQNLLENHMCHHRRQILLQYLDRQILLYNSKKDE